jgi:formylglycine-generating enzyme required for sulfatase activity
VLAASLSCRGEGELRGQTVLVLDTDLPVDRAGVADAVVDSLRIDVYAAGALGALRESREFAVEGKSFWPFSFGTVGPVRLRVRLFAARWTSAEAGAQQPRAEIAVDRLIDIAASSAVVPLRVLLAGDCRGVASDLSAGRSCVSALSPMAPAESGLAADRGEPSQNGSWWGLAETGCVAADDPDRLCIRGGFSVLGNAKLAGVITLAEQPLPLRPVVLSPFRMDRLEYTVGRYRALVQSGYLVREPAPKTAVSGNNSFQYCSYLGDGIADADALPLNCVSHALAEELCAAAGGRLPTEAEWEHAASGRGEGREFPWGNGDPSCCRASLERSPRAGVSAACPRRRPEPAGSHTGEGCPGGGDVARDGVLDLAGSLSEYTSDIFAPAGACQAAGVQKDPHCLRGQAWVVKGSDWTAGFGAARRAIRSKNSTQGSTNGFRCVYPEAPQ